MENNPSNQTEQKRNQIDLIIFSCQSSVPLLSKDPSINISADKRCQEKRSNNKNTKLKQIVENKVKFYIWVVSKKKRARLENRKSAGQ